MKLHVTVTPDERRPYPLHSHEEVEIMCYLKGEGELRTDAGGIPFAPGTLMLIPPGVRHGSCPRESFRNICLYCPSLPGVEEEILTGQDNATGDGRAMAQMLLRLLLAKHPADDALIWHLFEAYRAYVLRRIAVKDHKTLEVERVLARITEEFTDPAFDLAALVAQTGVSPDHFRVCFKAQNGGLTPLQVLTRLRLDCADDLMRRYGAQMSIGEVAARCGFADALYFSRVYKKNRGVSPANRSEKQ